jgi:glycerol-3-phosphate dehydrogenase (NAD(P)+)
MNIGIIGNGAWGRALATLAAKAGHQPRIGFRGDRPTGFPGTPNLAALSADSDLLLIAVHANAVRAVVDAIELDAGMRVVLATRGLAPDTGEWLSDLIVENTPCRRVGVLTGPAVASEVIAGRPTALVAASAFEEVCEATQNAFHSEQCRIYTSHDLRGVELAGAMVRVLGVALGIADGVDLGVGALGVIVTRGLAEATRLGEALGAHPKTFSGLAGVGDLVSCASSPNHPSQETGRAVARGGTATASVMDETRSVLAIAKRKGVDMPLTEAVLAIAAGDMRPKLAFDELMRRSARSED